MMRTILNLIWLIFCGLWMAVAYAIAGLIAFVLIITIPLAAGSFKIIPITLLPLGVRVVPADRVYAEAA